MRRCGKLPRLAACLLAGLLVACGNNGAGNGAGGVDLVIVASPAALVVAPGAQGSVEFTLQDATGRPQAGRSLRLALLLAEPPDAGAAPTSGGASLVTTQGTTDARGRFVASFRAGTEGEFRLRATNTRSQSQTVTVKVAAAATGKAEAVALLDPGIVAASLEMRLFPDLACDQLRANTPALDDPALAQKLQVSARWTLPLLAVQQSYGLITLALDQQGALAGYGCVNIDGRTLLQSTPVVFTVPVGRPSPSLASRYLLASELVFSPDLAPGAGTAIEAWGRLAGCPHDPAQLWLDCTLDALGPTNNPDDPLDCRPAPDEGALGQLMAARLGTLAKGSNCRGDKDVGGQPSLDARVHDLFPASGSPIVAALPSLAAEVAGMFRRIRLSSTLEFVFTGRPRTWQAFHAVTSVGFPVGDAFHSVNLLDRPGRFSRFVVATLDETGQRIDLASHGFGVRLGHVARAAFSARALQLRGFPGDETAFVNVLYRSATLAQPAVDPLTGCAALDERVCSDLGQAPGCLLAACELGVQSLAAVLRKGFDELDGEDLDVFLRGGANLADRQADGTISSLGSLLANRVGPGLWTGELRSLAGVTGLTGLWVGTRAPGQ